MDAFLLTRDWRDTGSGTELVLWARAAEGPLRIRIDGVESVMFVPRGQEARADRYASPALETPDGVAVDALYFRSQRGLVEERARLRKLGLVVLESDLKPQERFLMERFITSGLRVQGQAVTRAGVLRYENPTLKAATVSARLSVLSLDLETDGFDGPLLSAAIATPAVERVFVRGAGPDTDAVRFVPDEASLLRRLFAAIRELDPDLIIGWNLVEFDLTVLQTRAQVLGVELAIGRGGEVARVLPRSMTGVSIARIPGRVALDGILALKAATHRYESYTLEHVAQALLGRGKRLAAGTDAMSEILRMHAEDPLALAAYNLEDCRLVLEIVGRLQLVEFLMERQRLTGLPMDRPGGSVAAFDHLYLPRLHRKGLVAHDVDSDVELTASPGGHVLESVPGLYRDILAFDFRSLYPSIIRTYRIDPFGLLRPGEDPLPGEDGACFARDPDASILPGIIATLHEARSSAMAAKDEALSRAIKILMNSFYGVLGTPGCRFFDARLVTSITRRGHAVIERARAFFLGKGLRVIYGDTDSLFVEGVVGADATEIRATALALAAELTRALAEELRVGLRIESFLELKFDAHYVRFLMPRTRDAARGAKKRYAGLQRDGAEERLVIRGLEAVRTDWTPLARRVQRELLARVLADGSYEAWLDQLTSDLLRGALDAELGQTKDYPSYVARQLAPACDVVLNLLGTSFDRVAGIQRALF